MAESWPYYILRTVACSRTSDAVCGQEHFTKMGSKFINNEWDIDDENMMNYHELFSEILMNLLMNISIYKRVNFWSTFDELFEVLLMNFVHQNYDEPFINIWTQKCSWKFRRKLCLICCWWTSNDIWWIWPEPLMNVHEQYMISPWIVHGLFIIFSPGYSSGFLEDQSREVMKLN